MSFRNFVKKSFDDWVYSRQISVCRKMLGQHGYALGPTHRKEIHHLMSELQSRRSNRNLM